MGYQAVPPDCSWWIDGYICTHAIFQSIKFPFKPVLFDILLLQFLNMKVNMLSMDGFFRFQIAQQTLNDPRHSKVYQLKKGAVAATYPS